MITEPADGKRFSTFHEKPAFLKAAEILKHGEQEQGTQEDGPCDLNIIQRPFRHPPARNSFENQQDKIASIQQGYGQEIQDAQVDAEESVNMSRWKNPKRDLASQLGHADWPATSAFSRPVTIS